MSTFLAAKEECSFEIYKITSKTIFKVDINGICERLLVKSRQTQLTLWILKAERELKKFGAGIRMWSSKSSSNKLE